jgi:hypothetical protein
MYLAVALTCISIYFSDDERSVARPP